MTKKTCLSCGKQFTSWRGKMYCSEACRKRAENRRLRGDESRLKGMISDAENDEKKDEQNQKVTEAVRGDEIRAANWIACNEVTDKLDLRGTAIGWTMRIEGRGWFGRVGEEMSFGPTTRSRAQQSVEAYLKGEFFKKDEDERSWRGDCWGLIAA